MQIMSVFDRWLAGQARKLAVGTPGFAIISVNDFPVGAPIHEDGSSTYDPRKPLAYFAVELSSKAAIDAWNGVSAEFDGVVAEDLSAGGDHGRSAA
jgi:hypothetical protein